MYQKTLAKFFEVTIRTIQNWVAELRQQGLLVVKKRAAETPTRRAALYILNDELVSLIFASGFAKGFTSATAELITRVKAQFKPQAAAPPRKPVQSESELPWSVQEALIKAGDRIRRAMNPAALRQFIINAEMKKLDGKPTRRAELVDWRKPGALARYKAAIAG